MELNLAISARRAGFLTLTLGALIFSFAWAPQSLAQLATSDITIPITSDHIKNGDVTGEKLYSSVYSSDEDDAIDLLRAASKRTLGSEALVITDFKQVNGAGKGTGDGISAAKFADKVLGAFNNDLVTSDGNVQLMDGSVTAEKIGIGAVGTEQLAMGAVAGVDIAEGTITLADIASGAVLDTRIDDAQLERDDSVAKLVGGDSSDTFDSDDDYTDSSSRTTLKSSAYEGGSLRQVMNYWEEQLGLNSEVGGVADGNLQARTNAAVDSLSGQQRTGGGTIADFNEVANTVVDAADAPAARRGVYNEFTAAAYKQYWEDRIGLDPGVMGARNGNLQEQTNWAKDAVGARNSDTVVAGPTTAETDASYDDGNLNARFNYLGEVVGLGVDPDDLNSIDESDRDAADLTSRVNYLVKRAGARTDNAGAAIETAATDATTAGEDVDAARLTAYQGASSFGQNNYWATRIGLDVNARIAKAAVLADFSALNGATLTQNINYAVDELLGSPSVADSLADFDTKAKVLATALTQADYRAAHAGAQMDYWSLRVGLDPTVKADDDANRGIDRDAYRTGNLWERSAYVRGQVGLRTDNARVAIEAAVGDMARLDAYRMASAHAQRNYWMGRIGLNAEETATEADYDNPDVTLAAQINWLRQEVGQREDVIDGFEGADSWTKTLSSDVYDTASLREQSNYWADRIGLNPNATPSRVGSIQAQTNYVKREFDLLGRAVAMAAAMRDVAIPYGQDTGASFTMSNHGGERGYALSLAYASGDSSKFTLSMASTSDQDESLFRMGYDIAW